MTVDTFIQGYDLERKKEKKKWHNSQEHRKEVLVKYLSSLGIKPTDKEEIKNLIEILSERKQAKTWNVWPIITFLAGALMSTILTFMGKVDLKDAESIAALTKFICVILITPILVFIVEKVINCIFTKKEKNIIIDLENILVFPPSSCK